MKTNANEVSWFPPQAHYLLFVAHDSVLSGPWPQCYCSPRYHLRGSLLRIWIASSPYRLLTAARTCVLLPTVMITHSMIPH
jgi:hypothetical protein